MILINLLPHREERRKRRKQAFFVGLGLAAAVGVAIAVAWLLVLQQMKAAQEERNNFLKQEITKLEAEIKDVASLRSEIERLKARQKAVEDFQTDRNLPVHMLNELVKQTPEGVFLTSVRQAGETVTITGVAQTNERVSEFLRNTAYNSPWLERPELLEIRAAAPTANANANQPARDPRRVFDFSMRVALKRNSEPEGKAVAAPAPAASAAVKR
jgi:type IV pilus assembly protein PilN